MPIWRRDGKELFYLGPAGRVVAVPVSSTNGSFDRDGAIELFRTMLYGDLYVPSADGERFLIARPSADSETVALDIVVNPIH